MINYFKHKLFGVLTTNVQPMVCEHEQTQTQPRNGLETLRFILIIFGQALTHIFQLGRAAKDREQLLLDNFRVHLRNGSARWFFWHYRLHFLFQFCEPQMTHNFQTRISGD